jgi:hypothetical protein
MDRAACRAHAVAHCSLDAMVDAYVATYLSMAPAHQEAA